MNVGKFISRGKLLVCSYIFCYTEPQTQITSAGRIKICPLQIETPDLMLFVMTAQAGTGQWHSSDIHEGCGKYKGNTSVISWPVIA